MMINSLVQDGSRANTLTMLYFIVIVFSNNSIEALIIPYSYYDVIIYI